LSTLTKVLIVLLTISSIFLCGIVVTYVANAVNYQEQYNQQRQNYVAAQGSEENAKKQLNDLKEKTGQEKIKLDNEIADLEVKINNLEVQLEESESEKALLLQRVNNWTSIVQDFTATNDKQGQLLQNALDELDRVQTELIKEQREHQETTTALIEKMAIVALLEDKSNRLTEEKADLQNKLDQFLRQYGRTVTPIEPVTPIRDTARVAPPTQDIGLKGSITVVDIENLLAQVSIGAAHGVKEGTRFHVIRGDRFVCDVVIFDVQPEMAMGILDLLKADSPPRVGDEITTNM
jgi:hypothetical protein